MSHGSNWKYLHFSHDLLCVQDLPQLVPKLHNSCGCCHFLVAVIMCFPPCYFFRFGNFSMFSHERVRHLLLCPHLFLKSKFHVLLKLIKSPVRLHWIFFLLPHNRAFYEGDSCKTVLSFQLMFLCLLLFLIHWVGESYYLNFTIPNRGSRRWVSYPRVGQITNRLKCVIWQHDRYILIAPIKVQCSSILEQESGEGGEAIFNVPLEDPCWQ